VESRAKGVKSLLMNTLLVFVSICVALLLCEVLLRVALPQDLSGSWGEYTKEGLLANKNSGTAFHQLGARRVEYHFAPPHLRDLDSDLPAARRPSQQVLVVGDSFTFGWLLSDRNTYVRRLEDYVNATRPNGTPRFRFLDAAMAGWGAADYTVYLRDYLPHVRPEYVLVFVNTDDIGRALRSPLVSLQAGRLMFRKGPPHRFKALINGLPLYNFLVEHSQVVAAVRKAFWAIDSGKLRGLGGAQPENTIVVPGNDYSGSGDSAEATALGEALFDEIIRVCGANQAKLIVLTTGFMKSMTPNNPTSAFYKDLPAFLAARRVPFIDISTEFAAATHEHLDDYLIPIARHPNERGAALIAALIGPELRAAMQLSGPTARRTSRHGAAERCSAKWLASAIRVARQVDIAVAIEGLRACRGSTNQPCPVRPRHRGSYVVRTIGCVDPPSIARIAPVV
jgi:GDSL-like Lipase/Acylhydrolase family